MSEPKEKESTIPPAVDTAPVAKTVTAAPGQFAPPPANCPNRACNSRKTKLVESVKQKDGSVKAERECTICGWKFSTTHKA